MGQAFLPAIIDILKEAGWKAAPQLARIVGSHPTGVKIKPYGVSIVAAGVPAGQMVAFIRSPLRKSSATQVKFSCEFGCSLAHDGRQGRRPLLIICFAMSLHSQGC